MYPLFFYKPIFSLFRETGLKGGTYYDKLLKYSRLFQWHVGRPSRKTTTCYLIMSLLEFTIFFFRNCAHAASGNLQAYQGIK